MSVFDHLKPISPSGINKVMEKYNADPSEAKIDLASGEYRDYDGKTWVLPSVKIAEQEVHEEEPIIPDYSFPDAKLFPKLATELLLGENSPALEEDRVHSAQTMSGTSALRIGAEFLVRLMGKTIYYYSDPTWNVQSLCFGNAGFKEARTYRYWNSSKREVDFDGLLGDLKSAPEGAVILLHASAHNPTGIDLTKDQWKQIAVVMKERNLFPFLDSAFQGFAKDLEDDAWSVRYFVDQGFELICVQSFSKNCGLYSERIGNIFFVTKNKHAKDLVAGNLDSVISGMYLVPSATGNRILSRLWSKPELRKLWLQDLETMRNRIANARKQLREALERLGTPGDWSFMTRQIGVASLTGLSEKQVDHLADKHHLYILPSGRINFTAVTCNNVEYVANGIHETLCNTYFYEIIQ